MARILVTGSDGFIGKHLIGAMAEYDVVPCDVGTQSVEGPFDGIIHLAAVSRVRDAEADRIKCLETNIIFTANLLEFKPSWFIFASTCEPPHNIYGFSKRAAEQYIELRGGKYIILRLSNVYGPGMAKDKLLSKLREDKDLKVDSSVFPFEYAHVDDVVERILDSIDHFELPVFNSYTMKISNGIARDKDDLYRVATSY